MRTLVTLGLGALAMYLFDPNHGRQRRALMRDRLNDLRSRASGMGEARAVSTELEPDRPSDTPEGTHHLGR